MSLEHKSSVKLLGYIYNNSQKYIVSVKIIDFYFMPKIIRILRSCSMKIFSKFPTINISKLNFWLVICIAKNFIWPTLKMIFSIFRCFCTLRFQIFKYCPNHTSMEIFRWCESWFWNLNLEKWTLKTGFVLQGHAYDWHAKRTGIFVYYKDWDLVWYG